MLPGQAPMPASNSPYPVAVAMRQQIPEVTGMTHLTGQRITVMIGDRLFLDQFHVVDPNFFQIIKLPLVEGSPATRLLPGRIRWCCRKPARANISAMPNRWARPSS